MRNFIPGIASTIAAEEMTYFFLLELQLGGATVRYDNNIEKLFHFDNSLKSTDGLEPQAGHIVTLREKGWYGGAVAIEEATVNLIATQGNAAQNWTAWRHWDTVATTYWASQGTFNDPDYGAVWWGIGTSSESLIFGYRTYTLLQGQTITFSIYLKTDEEITFSNPKFYTKRADNTTDFVDHDPVSITLTPEWQRFTWTTTLPADAEGIGVIFGTDVLDGKKIYAAYPQLEEKPFATSFVNGSRAAGKLVYPNLYRPRQGTISMRVMFDLDPADWPTYQCLCDWSTSINDRMLLYTNNQLLKFRVKDATNDIVASIDLGASGQNISAGVWYSVSITWDFNGNACLYFEDVSDTSDISSLSLTTREINLTVGTDYPFGNFLNGLIDEFRIDNIARTPEEILAWHNSNAPFIELGTTYRITDGDIPIIHDGKTFTPIAFKFGDISGSATLAVESIDIEIDDTGKTLAAIVLNEDIRNKWAILSVGAIDSEYVVHVQEFLRGIIGGWQLYDENTLKITITNELVLWNKKPLRIQMSSCPWVFKGTECAYSGAESTCDQTYERCRFLGNTDNFGGDRFINSLMQKEIWWGRTQKL